jgi:hypothetical protein
VRALRQPRRRCHGRGWRAWADGLPKARITYRLTARAKPSSEASFELGAHAETTSGGRRERVDVFASVHISGGAGGRSELELTGPLAPPGLDLGDLLKTVTLP